jgi:hypothetical protein
MADKAVAFATKLAPCGIAAITGKNKQRANRRTKSAFRRNHSTGGHCRQLQ